MNENTVKIKDPVLSIRNLSVSYDKGKYAVNNVSADIKRNSVTAIMGPSGCGKSTLLRAINRMHELMDQYQLDSQIRWVEFLPDKNFVGELYRSVVDSGGVFVQPALFEAFGLTVVEAMSCGLPVFATCFGGPLEIIQDGKSGFHIDPNQGEKSAEKLTSFFDRCGNQPGYWETISRNSIERVEERYTWTLYARRLMTLSRIYGFWRFITRTERQENNRYLEMFYNLMYKRLAKTLEK